MCIQTVSVMHGVKVGLLCVVLFSSNSDGKLTKAELPREIPGSHKNLNAVIDKVRQRLEVVAQPKSDKEKLQQRPRTGSRLLETPVEMQPLISPHQDIWKKFNIETDIVALQKDWDRKQKSSLGQVIWSNKETGKKSKMRKRKMKVDLPHKTYLDEFTGSEPHTDKIYFQEILPDIVKVKNASKEVRRALDKINNDKHTSIIVKEIDVFREKSDDGKDKNDKSNLYIHKKLEKDASVITPAKTKGKTTEPSEEIEIDSTSQHPTTEFELSTTMEFELTIRETTAEPNPHVNDSITELDSNTFDNPEDQELSYYGSSSAVSRETVRNSSLFKSDAWLVPMLVISCTSILVMMAHQALLCIRGASSGPAQSHPALLTGLVLCSLSSLLHLITPSPLVCGLLRFGPGLACTLVYSSLLLRIVARILLARGILLPSSYQATLITCSLLLQIILGTQWLVSVPPVVVVEDTTCITSFPQHLRGYLYPLVLLALALLPSVRYSFTLTTLRTTCLALVLSVINWIVVILLGQQMPSKTSLISCLGLVTYSLTIWTSLCLPWPAILLGAGEDKGEEGKGELLVFTLFSAGESGKPRKLLKPLNKKLLVEPQREKSDSSPPSGTSSPPPSDPESDDVSSAAGSLRFKTQGKERLLFTSDVHTDLTNQETEGPGVHSYTGGQQGATRRWKANLHPRTKPSPSNPNVLFCCPEDVHRNMVYYSEKYL